MNKRGIFSIEFIRRTAEEKIHSFVIGRQAMAVYGAPTATNDLDLLVVSELEEQRLCSIAEEFDLVKVLEETGGIIYHKKQIRYADDPKYPIHQPRIVDILTIPRLRSFSFEVAWKRRVPICLDDGNTFYLPYVDDLIALKRARNHLRDKEDISWLKRNRKDLIKLFPSC